MAWVCGRSCLRFSGVISDTLGSFSTDQKPDSIFYPKWLFLLTNPTVYFLGLAIPLKHFAFLWTEELSYVQVFGNVRARYFQFCPSI